MQSSRCGHFLLETEVLVVPGVPLVIRIPVRRCLLSERMIAQMAQNESGLAVARKLSLASSTLPTTPERSQEAQGNSLTQPIRAALGPDLEPIHGAECLEARCLQSCTPGYYALLAQFGVTPAAGDNPGKGCLEPSVSADENA